MTKREKPASPEALIAEAVTSIVDGLEVLTEREDKLAALSLVVHLLTRNERAAPVVAVQPFVPLPLPPPVLPVHEDSERAEAIADLERVRRPPRGAPRGKHGKRGINGSMSMRKEALDTLEFVKSKGVVAKRHVAEKFGISDSGAYQRLMNLARVGHVNHSGNDEWRAT